MKTLLLLRHAKSSHDQPGIGDHDRGLTERGKQNADRAGELLRERGLLPGIVLSSTARRARKTAKRVLRASGASAKRELLDDLYLAPPQSYATHIRELPDKFHTVLVVGHNPGMEELLQKLIGAVQSVPTTGLAQLEVPIESWADFSLGTRCQLSWFWSPSQES
jgi:phosphohistidine phosphatase